MYYSNYRSFLYIIELKNSMPLSLKVQLKIFKSVFALTKIQNCKCITRMRLAGDLIQESCSYSSLMVDFITLATERYVRGIQDVILNVNMHKATLETKIIENHT